MDLPVRIIINYNVTRRYTIRLKFAGKLLTSLTKLMPQARAKICCTIKRSVLLHCRNFKEIPLIIETINSITESLEFQNRHLSGAHCI